VWQPIGYWLLHLLLRRPREIVTPIDWLRFELGVAAVGAIGGVWWFYSRRSIPRTRAQYWADSGMSVLAICSMLAADNSVSLPWILWVLMIVVVSVPCGILFGSVALFVANSINSSRTD
jgi:hypothetical protein